MEAQGEEKREKDDGRQRNRKKGHHLTISVGSFELGINEPFFASMTSCLLTLCLDSILPCLIFWCNDLQSWRKPTKKAHLIISLI